MMNNQKLSTNLDGNYTASMASSSADDPALNIIKKIIIKVFIIIPHYIVYHSTNIGSIGDNTFIIIWVILILSTTNQYG